MSRNLFVTFLISGLWHGASWNYVIWGAYHGALLVIARLVGPRTFATRGVSRAIVVVLQTTSMFALTLVGWLIFRETDLHYLQRAFALSPWQASLFDVQVGRYLFMLTALYSLPLWLDSLWAVYGRPGLEARRADASESVSWWTVIGQGALAGLAVALILVLRSRQSLDFIYFQF